MWPKNKCTQNIIRNVNPSTTTTAGIRPCSSRRRTKSNNAPTPESTTSANKRSQLSLEIPVSTNETRQDDDKKPRKESSKQGIETRDTFDDHQDFNACLQKPVNLSMSTTPMIQLPNLQPPTPKMKRIAEDRQDFKQHKTTHEQPEHM